MGTSVPVPSQGLVRLFSVAHKTLLTVLLVQTLLHPDTFDKHGKHEVFDLKCVLLPELIATLALTLLEGPNLLLFHF